jgi:NAD(P)H-dependent FMN reductase
MAHLGVVVASTREDRAGWLVSQWFVERAKLHGTFDVQLIDLKEVNLPLLDEPNHPRLQKYQRDSTKAWSARVASIDAFVFVTPEYNHGMSPALLNALDHLYVEWNYKPCGFVSYGGVSGGTRGVQAAKPVIAALKMVPIVESVTIPFIARQTAGGRFSAGDPHDKAAAVLLDELARWEEALRVLRSQGNGPLP